MTLSTRALVVVSALLLGSVALSAAPVAAGASPAASSAGAIAAASGAIASYRPGQVVSSHPVAAWTFGGPLAVSAWQLTYRTNDAHGQAELGITTLVVPKAPWRGHGPRPAVSVQAAEDGDGSQCAPSAEISSNTDVADPAEAASLLAVGYAVAVPDHEGPKSVFLAGPQEGHAVLDGIRAVENFDHAGVGRSNKWALDGYSGGANATGWAAQLAGSYAPDIPLVGAALGGTPSDPIAVARALDGGIASGLEFAAAASIAIEWPEAGIEQLLNARGRAAFSKITGECAPQILAGYPFQRLADYTNVADPLDVPSVKRVLTLDTLGAQAPSMAIYDYHGTSDEIVPVAQDDALVTKWCRGGAVVDKVRDPGEHLSEVVVRYLSVQAWITQRFDGQPAPSSC